MADEHSTANEAAALLCRAASLLTQRNSRNATDNNNVAEASHATIHTASESLNSQNQSGNVQTVQSNQSVIHSYGRPLPPKMLYM